jgi:hypothetical protein
MRNTDMAKPPSNPTGAALPSLAGAFSIIAMPSLRGCSEPTWGVRLVTPRTTYPQCPGHTSPKASFH